MRCPQCQTDLPEDSKFCKECGTKLELICPECGNTIPRESKFCPECGNDLGKPKNAPPIGYQEPRSYTPKFLAEKILTSRSAIEGERKVVTVLFADVAGFTSMSEKLDAEDVHQIMDGCFRILLDEIHRYEGTINQFTGDGVMALFGAPLAHEDHAQRACHASLAIQKALIPYSAKLHDEYGVDFKMRIGLNSGPVVVGSVGDDLRMDYTALGDTANLAARMESNAQPGSVLLSEHTYRLAKEFFEFEPVGQIQVKGKEEPVEAYRLVKPSKVETRIAASAAKGLTRFLGRQREIDNLKEAFAKAQSGEGQVIGVVGEAGVGKSRLLLEFRKSLPKGESIYLEGCCLHYGSSMPYLPILDLVKSYVAIEEGDRHYMINRRLKERIFTLDENLQRVLPPFQELLSLTVEDETYPKLHPRYRREKRFEAVRDLLVTASQERPLILAIEDLQWIDKSSEELLGYFIEFLPRASILLILLYRPEYTHPWGSKSYYGKIGVDRLGAKTGEELVKAILDENKIVPELKELILTRASGNPLYMEEMTHALLERSFVQKDDGRYSLVGDPANIEVPDTLQGIIAARMDRLEETLKRILQVASVIGREFGFSTLQAVIETDEDLKSNLLNLQGLEFIYEKSLFPEVRYVFRHALTREVAYNSLLITKRKELHEKIGRAIEDIYSDRLTEYYEVLAFHYDQSENTGKALEYLDLSNQKAGQAYAMDEAKAYFDRAMALLDTLPETDTNAELRISLLANQRWVMIHLFKISEYYDLLSRYEVLLTKIVNPGLVGSFYERLGFCEWFFGLLDLAHRNLTKAAQITEIVHNAEDAGHAYTFLAWTYVWTGDFRKVLDCTEKAVRHIEQDFNIRTPVIALNASSLASSFLGHWDAAVDEGKRSLRAAREFSDNSLICQASFILGTAMP